jgi:prephenate dehydrogenase
MPSRFKKAGIVGVGLIGGSFAAALKAHGLADRVIGVGRHAGAVDEALALGLIDEASTQLQALYGCDLILLAVPVAQTGRVLAGALPFLDDTAIVTDAGSTKRDVVAAARTALGSRIAQFVPGHPIAGKEASGPAAADAALYAGKRVVLTPLAENSATDVARLQAIWQAIGAQVSVMTAEQHDAVFGAADSATKLAFAGGGFRDFTRIAASSPEMWRDIFLANKDALLAELDDFSAMLGTARDLLQAGDAAAIERWLAHAAATRQNWAPHTSAA